MIAHGRECSYHRFLLKQHCSAIIFTKTTSKTGADTFYAYSSTPAMVLSYTNPTANTVGRVSRTTLDGFGRAIKVESGTGTYTSGAIALTTTVSTVESA